MKTKAIRSIRVATELIMQGHRMVRVEPSLQSRGYAVFIFKDSPELQRVLTESSRKNSAN